MSTHKRTRGSHLAPTWRNASSLVTLLVTKNGSFTTLSQRSLSSQKEQNLMRDTSLVSSQQSWRLYQFHHPLTPADGSSMPDLGGHDIPRKSGKQPCYHPIYCQTANAYRVPVSSTFCNQWSSRHIRHRGSRHPLQCTIYSYTICTSQNYPLLHHHHHHHPDLHLHTLLLLILHLFQLHPHQHLIQSHPSTPPLALRCPRRQIQPPGEWWRVRQSPSVISDSDSDSDHSDSEDPDSEFSWDLLVLPVI